MANKIIAKSSKTELSFDLDLTQDSQKFDSVESPLNEFTFKDNGDSVTILDKNNKDLVTIKSSSEGNTIKICLTIPKPDLTDPNSQHKATISMVL